MIEIRLHIWLEYHFIIATFIFGIYKRTTLGYEINHKNSRTLYVLCQQRITFFVLKEITRGSEIYVIYISTASWIIYGTQALSKEV